MCGIVGLHLRDPALYPQLGRLLVMMLGGVAERGPDSAGVAVYGDHRRCPAGYAAAAGLEHDPAEFRRYGSARRLYHFISGNTY
jgi:glutamate synthase domain-containing protein 1